MHELSIAQEILKIAQRQKAERQETSRLKEIHVQVGGFSNVVPSALRSAFEVLVHETPFQGAVLHIDQAPLVIQCRECGKRSKLNEPTFVCPSCEGFDLDIISGQELVVQSIVLEEQDQEEETNETNTGRRENT